MAACPGTVIEPDAVYTGAQTKALGFLIYFVAIFPHTNEQDIFLLISAASALMSFCSNWQAKKDLSLG